MVALKMDEISSSDDVIVNVNASDNNPLYTQINKLLNESVNDVLTKAPIYRIKEQQLSVIPSSEFSMEKAAGTKKKAVAKVPADFLRIVSITDNLFQRPIVDLALEGDRVDAMQHNKHLVAGYAKPVAVLGRGSDGRRVISCYSYEADDATTTNALYIKRYENDETLYLETELDDYLTEIVAWVCAGKVFASRGDVNNGKLCDENAMALMV